MIQFLVLALCKSIYLPEYR